MGSRSAARRREPRQLTILFEALGRWSGTDLAIFRPRSGRADLESPRAGSALAPIDAAPPWLPAPSGRSPHSPRIASRCRPYWSCLKHPLAMRHCLTVTDFLSKETRSRVMSRIRSTNTKPELALRRSLWSLGVRGWRCHTRGVPGKPDIAFTRWRLAVFVDGCFWHGHPDFFTPGKSGAYWDAKIARTKQRDQETNADLASLGWQVLRFWDFEVELEPDRCAARVQEALRRRQLSSPAASRTA
jgi:DNA mismatch endonuclease, patch repair protein